MTRRIVLLVGVLGWCAAGSFADDPPAGPDRPPVRAVAFSPDGKRLVAATGNKDRPGAVVAWDVATGQRLWAVPRAAGFTSLSYAPDGGLVAVTDGRPAARLLDAATGKDAGEFGPHGPVVRAVAFLPGTGLLATAADGDILLWDVKTRAVRATLKGHSEGVWSLVPSPTGKWLVSSGDDTTRVWDVAAAVERKDVIRQARGTSYNGVAFVGPDRVIMTNNGAERTVRDIPAGEVVLRFTPGGAYSYEAAAYSPAAGLYAAIDYEAQNVSLSDVAFRSPTPAESDRIGRFVSDFDSDDYAVREAASAGAKAIGWSAEPALRLAMTAGPSPEVRMRAREARRAILGMHRELRTGHTAPVRDLAFAPDGSALATGSEDGTVRLYDPKSGRELARLDPAAAGGP
ncbi:MAG TPA: hypothetical protein VH092_34375 [Urbifossiella sp.]|nr:hypothetical protein [Urbifossiella sp.]